MNGAQGGSYGGGYQTPYTPKPRGGLQYQPQTGGEMFYNKTPAQPTYALGAGSPQYAPNPGNPNEVTMTGFGKPSLAQQSDANVGSFFGYGRTPDTGGLLANQQASFQPAPAPQQQSFEQFAATLGNNGMTSGQMQDAYQKSLQPASTNFWANTGVGTQKPAGFVTPPQWGTQTYGFDPKAMAGKQVTGDLGWYYGRDAIGRTINNQGDAVAGFSRPADGFQRSRPWFA